jgi:hypothetical protein
MSLFNSLFEAWLREATQKPLASWKRTALLWRLQEDEDLRCYAAELAQFSHEAQPAKTLSDTEMAWMRGRLQALVEKNPHAELPSWSPGFGAAAVGLALGAAVLAITLLLPSSKPDSSSTQGASSDPGAALSLPTPTVTPTQTPDADNKAMDAGPSPEASATPAI